MRVLHRAGGRVAPANTLAGLAAALAHPVDAVELDVVASPRDGALVLAHDLRAAARAAPAAPSLEAALALLASPPYGALRVLVDLKADGIEARVAAALAAHALTGRALVCAREPRALRAVAAADPALTRGWSLRWPWHARLVGERRVAPAVRRARAEDLCDVLLLHHRLARPPVIAAARGAGAEVVAWTVNDPRTAARLAARGVDGIVTDDPAVLAGLR